MQLSLKHRTYGSGTLNEYIYKICHPVPIIMIATELTQASANAWDLSKAKPADVYEPITGKVKKKRRQKKKTKQNIYTTQHTT